MEREIAEKIVKQLSSLSEDINSLTDLSEEIRDQDEAKMFRRILGEIILKLDIDLLEIVTKQYPDLDPDWEILRQEHQERERAKKQKE